ncbi:hypothetical protein [Marispirochaeta aestuarii]|uniref:hypothetical protein n=1 Tax=Marispirochaeta aestuarii TaxID=1963862 RepID=UPI002ABE5EA0|nr:hypothetical protein [Marispirochaeta aestuarii]
MRSTGKHIFLSLLILTGFLFLSCTTSAPPRYESTTKMIQDEKFNIQARIVTREELEKQAGRTPSPFVIEPGLFDPREYVVIELIINNKTDNPAGFEIKDLEMRLGAGYYYTKNSFQIMQYWENHDEDINSADKQRMKTITERYMLDRKVQIPDKGLKRGYVVFLSKMPKYGEMTILLPIFGGGYKPDFYEFTFPFTRF